MMAIRMELLASVKRVTEPGYPPGDKSSNRGSLGWQRVGGRRPTLGPINAGVQAVQDLVIIDAEVDGHRFASRSCLRSQWPLGSAGWFSCWATRTRPR